MKYEYSEEVAKRLREGILQGLALTKIHDSMKHLQACPASMSTLTKVYGQVIAEARVSLDEKLLTAFWKKVGEGDSRMIELGLRTKVGFNPPTKVEDTTGDPNEDTTPLDKLQEFLNKKITPKE